MLVAGCGRDAPEDRAQPPAPPTASTTSATTAAAPAPPPAPPQRLPIGISEANPALLAPGAAPAGFGPSRDALLALHPRYVRVFVDWAKLQPSPDRPADLAAPADGCLRGRPPCAPFAGVRGQLAAVAALQRAQGGAELVVAVYGVPDWAARGPGGCERADTLPRARPITDAGMRGYTALLRAIRDTAQAEGVTVAYWIPWNESNHPAFVSPQRPRCDARAPSRAPRVYARFVRAARATLGPAARLVLGELAGFEGPRPQATGVAEFVQALPDDVACDAAVWSQHDYVWQDGGQPDAVKELERALDARPCTSGARVWVTETGVGGVRSGRPRDRRPAALARQCRAMHAQLTRWAQDPRVGAAFQYTFREDTAYPVGLSDAGLTRTYPAYAAWLAWSHTGPDGPLPPVPPDCAA